MSLATVRTNVWDMLQVASPSASDDVLLLQAFNHTRLWAERTHDFGAAKTVAYITVTATTGSLLSTATAGITSGVPSGSAVDIKSVRRAEVYNTDGSFSGATLMSREKYWGLIDRANNLSEFSEQDRTSISGENVQSVFETKNVLYQDGETLYTPSTANVVARLWVCKWLAPYTSTASTDFLVARGEDFFFWDAVVQMNLKKGVFLPRNEGSIDPSSPLGMRNSAWEALVLWDSYRDQYNTEILA